MAHYRAIRAGFIQVMRKAPEDKIQVPGQRNVEIASRRVREDEIFELPEGVKPGSWMELVSDDELPVEHARVVAKKKAKVVSVI